MRAWPLNVARALIEAPPPQGAKGHERDLTRLVSAWPWAVSGGEDGRLALYQLSEAEPYLSVVQQRPLSQGPIMSLSLTQSPEEEAQNHTPHTLWVGGGAHPLDVHLFEVSAGELRERKLTFNPKGCCADR